MKTKNRIRTEDTKSAAPAQLVSRPGHGGPGAGHPIDRGSHLQLAQSSEGRFWPGPSERDEKQPGNGEPAGQTLKIHLTAAEFECVAAELKNHKQFIRPSIDLEGMVKGWLMKELNRRNFPGLPVTKLESSVCDAIALMRLLESFHIVHGHENHDEFDDYSEDGISGMLSRTAKDIHKATHDIIHYAYGNPHDTKYYMDEE